jgi:hypothetical protein
MSVGEVETAIAQAGQESGKGAGRRRVHHGARADDRLPSGNAIPTPARGGGLL